MTKKEANKAITQLTKTLRDLVNVNPNCLRRATIYIHHVPEDKLPEGFEFEKDWGGYYTYRKPFSEADLEVTVFTD